MRLLGALGWILRSAQNDKRGSLAAQRRSMHVIREAVTVHVGLDITYAAVLAAGDRSLGACWHLFGGDYDQQPIGRRRKTIPGEPVHLCTSRHLYPSILRQVQDERSAVEVGPLVVNLSNYERHH